MLDILRLPQRNFVRPLRASVSEYVQHKSGPLIGDCVEVKVESGVLIEKSNILLMPENTVVPIKGILKEDGETEIPYALAGTICTVGLKLPQDFDINYLVKGNVICDIEYPIKLVKRFVCRVVIYDLPPSIGALAQGETVVVHSYTNKCPAKLNKFLSTVNHMTGETIRNRPKFVKKGMFVDIEIKLENRLCLELYSNYR